MTLKLNGVADHYRVTRTWVLYKFISIVDSRLSPKADCFATCFYPLQSFFLNVSKANFVVSRCAFCKLRRSLGFFSRQKFLSPSRYPSLFLSSLESFSGLFFLYCCWRGWENALLCINPAPTQMIDGTEKLNIP